MPRRRVPTDERRRTRLSRFGGDAASVDTGVLCEAPANVLTARQRRRGRRGRGPRLDRARQLPARLAACPPSSSREPARPRAVLSLTTSCAADEAVVQVDRAVRRPPACARRRPSPSALADSSCSFATSVAVAAQRPPRRRRGCATTRHLGERPRRRRTRDRRVARPRPRPHVAREPRSFRRHASRAGRARGCERRTRREPARRGRRRRTQALRALGELELSSCAVVVSVAAPARRSRSARRSSARPSRPRADGRDRDASQRRVARRARASPPRTSGRLGEAAACRARTRVERDGVVREAPSSPRTRALRSDLSRRAQPRKMPSRRPAA